MPMHASGSGNLFALIGAGGYVAPRHMRAIKETGGSLRAALDPADSVGVLDSYFPDCRFFVEFERFDRYVDLCLRRGERIDYVSICSPNYLHDAHVRFALRSGADAVCEKPLVLNPWNIEGLRALEQSTGRKVNTILQLRLHPAIQSLRDQVARGRKGKRHEVDLTYIASRGRWYYTSWKGDEAKSGGIATNIGVHFYDMLGFVFGQLERNVVHHRATDCAAGYLEYQRARVRWFLSINARDLPPEARDKQRTFRSITLDGKEIEFSEGFTDLHTASYREILSGRGFGLEQVLPSIEAVAHIRTAPIDLSQGERHPMLEQVRGDTGRYLHGWPV
jgi:UDP-N-acetyl-2-amino-2-deoxyglucuronate dehydrogenase